MRSKRLGHPVEPLGVGRRWSARSGGGVGRERTRSIQPWRLVSGVPI